MVKSLGLDAQQHHLATKAPAHAYISELRPLAHQVRVVAGVDTESGNQDSLGVLWISNVRYGGPNRQSAQSGCESAGCGSRGGFLVPAMATMRCPAIRYGLEVLYRCMNAL